MDTINTEMIQNVNSRAAFNAYCGNLPSEARMRVLKALAHEAGLRLSDTMLPEGTGLLPIGEEKRRAMKGSIDAMLSVPDALAALDVVIRAEDPIDSKVPVQRVRMDNRTARLYGEGTDPTGALAYTDAGLSHVLSMVKPSSVREGAKDVLMSVNNSIRADIFNSWARGRVVQDDAVLRTVRNPASGVRVIRAVTSGRHSLETGDDRAVATALLGMPEMLRDAKMRITRNFDRTDMEIVFSMLDREIRVGDVVKGSVRITNSETKAGSLKVECQLIRVLCYNFTIAPTVDERDEEIALRHVGDLRRKLPGAIRRALQRIEPLVRAFGDAHKVALPAFAPTRGEVLERVVSRFDLPEFVGTNAAGAWDADGAMSAGDTLAGLSHALTRASQGMTIEEATPVEQAAGRIIRDGWAALQ